MHLEFLGRGLRFDNAVRVSFRYDPRLVAIVKGLGQRSYDPATKSWEIPLGQVRELLRACSAAGVRVDVPLEVSSRIERKDIKARLEGIEPLVQFDFKTVPFPHQIEGFNFGLTHKAWLLADEQGLGKTKQAIDIAVAQQRLRGARACMIVCGVNGLRKNWVKEIRIHSGERSEVFKGSGVERFVQLMGWYERLQNGEECPFFGVVNIETLRGEKVKSQDKRKKWDYHPSDFSRLLEDMVRSGVLSMIVVDEVHKAKNSESLQGIAIRMIQAPYMLGLTGTPLLSKPEELWNLLVWLGVEKRSFWAFRQRYCIMGGYGGKQVVGYQNQQELHDLLDSVMLRRLKAEVLDLPPKVHQTEYVEMSEKHRRAYERIKLGIIDALDEFISNPLTAVLRLRQCTGGLLQSENPKLDRLEELLDEQIIPSGKKAIVFSNWTEVTEPVRARLARFNPAYVVGPVPEEQRADEVEKFQTDQSCKVIIGTIGAMGTGWTLTAGNYVIFLDKAWTPGDNDQAEDRAHRIGTDDTVFIISLVCSDTVDESIEAVLERKRALFEQVVEGRLPAMSRSSSRELLLELLGLDMGDSLF